MGINLEEQQGNHLPKTKREEEAAKGKEEAEHKPSTSKDADRGGPSTVQHPSPMSRVHCLDSPRWVRAALGSNPNKQHYNKDNCGCHACIKELAVVKMYKDLYSLIANYYISRCFFKLNIHLYLSIYITNAAFPTRTLLPGDGHGQCRALRKTNGNPPPPNALLKEG